MIHDYTDEVVWLHNLHYTEEMVTVINMYKFEEAIERRIRETNE